MSSDFTDNLRMAATPVCPDYRIAQELKAGLSTMDAVASVYFLSTDTALSVWVGVNKDDDATRTSIYRFEDDISQRFSQVLFDFHVVPVPAGRRMEDYISSAQPIFQRPAL
jgi:hypothetical protein